MQVAENYGIMSVGRKIRTEVNEMTITLQNRNGLTVSYNTSEIIKIECDKAGNRFNKSDLAGNGIKANEPVIIISFKDLTQSTFSSDWKIFF